MCLATVLTRLERALGSDSKQSKKRGCNYRPRACLTNKLTTDLRSTPNQATLNWCSWICIHATLQTKLRIFDDLAAKIGLFTEILNNKFSYKTLSISKGKRLCYNG